MSDTPLTKLDPAKLKNERHDVDLGSTEETAHANRDAETAQAVPGSDDPVHQPTSGVIPPAR